jgi:CubicO group peptidase (beta-lactamase class C family)
VAEPQWLASVRKSLLSALFGIAEREGRVALGATLAQLRFDDDPPLTPAEQQATVRQLLQGRSGVYHPAAFETPQMRQQRPRRGAFRPGTHFYYNNWDFNALGEIYQRGTGRDLFAAFEERIATPLGFADFARARHTRWTFDRKASRFPAYEIALSARDLARFGKLYLQRGSWAGRQIVPAAWIAESTRSYSATGGAGWWSGYGYMWWVASNEHGASTGRIPGGTFTAAGNGGRYLVVMPAADMVIAMLPEAPNGSTPIPLYADQRRMNGLLELLL